LLDIYYDIQVKCSDIIYTIDLNVYREVKMQFLFS
jgi:hypothetical protein